MKTGFAMVMEEPQKPLVKKEFPLPTPKEGELLVEVVQTNICGSDLHLFKGEMAPGFPKDVILGHEMAARVVEIGPGAETDSNGTPLKPGDEIAFRYFEPCMHCGSCARGRYNQCLTSLASVLRPASVAPHFVGGFATHYLVTRNRTRFKLPEGVSAKLAAGATCALSQVLYGITKADLKPLESVVIQGCGGLGLYAVALAKHLGAHPVIAIDMHPSRLEAAKSFGADFVVNASEITEPKERTKAVMDLTQGWGGDLVIEVVGRASVIPEGLRMLARGGRYLEMGSIVPRDYAKVDASILVGANQSIIGVSLYDDATLLKALEFLKHTTAPVEKLVGQSFSLEQANDALQRADALSKQAVNVSRVAICPHLED
jgi:D-arabinose 1-dehydrogenase-like Zn-dependent alcohol dehydrogenase